MLLADNTRGCDQGPALTRSQTWRFITLLHAAQRKTTAITDHGQTLLKHKLRFNVKSIHFIQLAGLCENCKEVI